MDLFILRSAATQDGPIGLLASLAQGLQEVSSVVVVQEKGLATVATVYRVVDRAWVLDSELSCHPKPNI